MRNKVLILGRLGADPEENTTNGGKTVCRLSVATSEKWTDRDGNKQEKTEWHRIVVWGELAVHCGRYLKKGRLVDIEGKLQTRSFDDNSGVKRYVTEIIALSVQFLPQENKEKSTDGTPSFQSNEEIPF